MQTDTKGTTASSNRKRSGKRSNKKRQGRKNGSGSCQKAPRVIAHSLFALTLKKKTGTEVFLGLENKLPEEFREDNCLKMYNDLLVSYRKGMELLGKEYSKLNLCAAGVPMHLALGSLIGLFEKEILPAGFNYNVDFDTKKNEYFFTIYSSCEFPWQWHAFEIKPIVYSLRNDPKTLNLFFIFVKCFQTRLSIPFWFNGALGNTLDFLVDQEVENLLEMEADVEEEEVKESIFEDFVNLMVCVDSYTEGEAKHYELILRNTPFYSPKRLLAEFKKVKGNKPLVKCMTDLLLLLDKGPSWDSYHYADYFNEMGEGVTIDQQIGVIWDWDDPLIEAHCQFIDDEANNCGVMNPMVHVQLRKGLTSFSKEKLRDLIRFPWMVSKAHDRYQSFTFKLKEKNAKRKN